MAKRKPVTDEERAAIISEFPSGKSCREIARQFKRGRSTISRIARDEGHEWGRPNLARAQVANEAYNEERRANLRLSYLEAIERMVRQLFVPHLAYNFGGRDNVYREHEVSEMPPREKQAQTNAIKNLHSLILEMDKLDTGRGDLGILDIIFAEIKSEADEYRNTDADAA